MAFFGLCGEKKRNVDETLHLQRFAVVLQGHVEFPQGRAGGNHNGKG